MKKMILFTTLLALILSLVGCKNSDKVTLNVYNWGDYIDEDIIDEFEERYDIDVNYDTYATNEDMYVKIKAGGSDYDISIPSDYMISKMIREDLLNKIDFDNISNYKNIGEEFKNLSFDPDNEYSVPYFWGTVGIIYNTSMIDEKIDSWDAFWDSKYKKQILMQDSQRESIGVALQKLGYSVNTTEVNELEQAKEELIKQKPLVLAYVVDEVTDKMLAGEAAMALVWSGDAVAMMEEDSNLEFIVPKEGSNFFVDSMVIPKTAKNKKEAEMFINFMLEKEIALKNTDYVGYSTPNTEAKNMLDEERKSNKAAYPDKEVIERCEVYIDLGDAIKEYDRVWTEVKASK